MPDVVVYAADYCPYCRQALALLDRKNVRYALRDVVRDPHLWAEIAERTGRNTVPQIFIDDRPIGGCDDLFALERRGALDSLLNP